MEKRGDKKNEKVVLCAGMLTFCVLCFPGRVRIRGKKKGGKGRADTCNSTVFQAKLCFGRNCTVVLSVGAGAVVWV